MAVYQDLANFAEALKIDYLPAIREQLNNSTYLLSKVRRNERDVSGSKWQSTVHSKRNAGVGSGTETALPTAGHQEWENPYGVVKYNRGRIQITGRFIQLGPPIEQLMGTITYLNSVDIPMGKYRANCIYAGV